MENFSMKDFLEFALAVTLLMVGNAASGAAKARKEGKFDINELKEGCLGYLLWLVTILCLVSATQIYGGDFNITIGGTNYTLLEAVDIAKVTVYTIYAGKLIQNVYQYAGVKKQVDLDKLLDERIENDDSIIKIVDQEEELNQNVINDLIDEIPQAEVLEEEPNDVESN